MTDQPRCETCRWWKFRDGHSYYGARGWCLNPVNDRITDGGQRFAKDVRGDDFCGEHQPKEPRDE